jgi:hypothetical protein
LRAQSERVRNGTGRAPGAMRTETSRGSANLERGKPIPGFFETL